MGFLKLPVCERTALVFAAWLQQFDNPPDWLPEIEIVEGILTLDGHQVCSAEDIETICCGVEAICFDTEDICYTVSINWPYDGNPEIGQIKALRWPTGDPSDQEEIDTILSSE